MQLMIEDDRDIEERFGDLIADVISDGADLLRQWISTTKPGVWIDMGDSLTKSPQHVAAYEDVLDQRKKYECIERSARVDWDGWSHLYFSWNWFPDSNEYLMITFYMPRHYVKATIYLREHLFPDAAVQ